MECDRFGTDTRLTHQLTERGSLDCIESAAVTTQNYPVVFQTSSVLLWTLKGNGKDREGMYEEMRIIEFII